MQNRKSLGLAIYLVLRLPGWRTKKPGARIQVSRLDRYILTVLFCIELDRITAAALAYRRGVNSCGAVPADDLLALLVVSLVATNLTGIERDANLSRIEFD